MPQVVRDEVGGLDQALASAVHNSGSRFALVEVRTKLGALHCTCVPMAIQRAAVGASCLIIH
jgi:hypothetical protein